LDDHVDINVGIGNRAQDLVRVPLRAKFIASLPRDFLCPLVSKIARMAIYK
jgi:hypothetical protein